MPIKDIDHARRELRVRRRKGGKDRVTMLPEVARAGGGSVAPPTVLERKAPCWATDPAWQWVFPAARRHRDRRRASPPVLGRASALD